MKFVMARVEQFAREDDVWCDDDCWNVASVTDMWSTIWPRLDPFLRTQTRRRDESISEAESRQGQIAWSTCYNKMEKEGRRRTAGT